VKYKISDIGSRQNGKGLENLYHKLSLSSSFFEHGRIGSLPERNSLSTS
jgi:hypothetical protein